MQLAAIIARQPTIAPMTPYSAGAPKFTGTNISDFLDEYDNLASLSRKDDADKIREIHMYCTSDFTKAVESLTADQTSWDLTKEKLTNFFGLADPKTRQNPNEELRNLADGDRIQDDDPGGMITLLSTIRTLQYRAKARGDTPLVDSELIRIVFRRFSQRATRVVAKTLSCEVTDVPHQSWTNVKDALVKWLKG
ncbi:hypothetical protein LX36DRAFT_246720 [Colletotrichum falcatum]|nr:hypothetical protein LX36DRAFT_246720 [Colletotrichum falcatum]